MLETTVTQRISMRIIMMIFDGEEDAEDYYDDVMAEYGE